MMKVYEEAIIKIDIFEDDICTTSSFEENGPAGDMTNDDIFY